MVLLPAFIAVSGMAEAFIIEGNEVKAEKSVSLEGVIDKTLKTSPMMKKISYDVEKAGTTLEQVEAMKILPTVNFQVRTGVVPEARGDVLHSQDSQTDLDGLGPFLQTELKLVQPIFTFGRISNGIDAAKKLQESQKVQSEGKVDEFITLAVQAYWSVYTTQSALKVANELKDAYKLLLTKIQEEIDKDDSDIDETYMFEAKSSQYMIEELANNCQAQYTLARNSLYEVSTLAVDDSTVFVDCKIPTCELTLDQMHDFIDLAVKADPDMLAIESGLQAMEAKIKYEKSRRLPLVYLGAGAGYGVAPNRDDQKNPFVYDAFNYLNVAAFLGLTWDLNFTQPNIEAKKWDLEKLALEESKKLLESKISIEAAKAFQDLINLYKVNVDLDKSLQAAKSWVTLSYDNWELSSDNPERLIKALQNYFTIRGKIIEKEYNYNLAIAKFAKMTGNFNHYIEWFKNEKIKLD